MPGKVTLAVASVFVVCVYYLFAWLFVGRDPKIGILVATYDPPRGLSPAMIRYLWKQGFDDRTFWAGILSLVAKGLAIIQSENGATRLRPNPQTNAKQSLPPEEEVLLDRLLRGKPRKGIAINMLESHTALAASDMAIALRQTATGRWLQENRTFVTIGIYLSVIAILAVGQPRGLEEWGVLAFSFALMVPAAFYLFFLSLRARDLYRALRPKFDGMIFRRFSILLFFMLSCIASVVFGSIVLGGIFGLPLICVALFLTILNVLQLHWMKAPTQDGGRLLTEIEGFRLFLQSVEHLPMQRADAPGDRSGLYERYLPYAVALEVEQEWGDKFLALASTFHQSAGLPGAESFYLGMWDGNAVEIVYRPQGPK